MNSQYVTSAEAAAIDALMPGNQVFGIGTRLRNSLMNAVPVRSKWFVDGSNGKDGNDGKAWDSAFATIQNAIDFASVLDTIIILPKAIPAGASDPVDYAENLIIPATKPGLTLIGFGAGRVQGGIPQLKKGSGASALLTVRAPGCSILGLGVNGNGSTGGGILLDDDAATKTAFGTLIAGCHFKNCKGSSATDSRTGGAIQWSASGGAWQVRILKNMFYKNVGDVVLLGTGGSVPQDVVIEDNIFSGPAASVDCNLYLGGGSGMNGVTIINNKFVEKPNIGSGSVAKFISATGCIGLLAGNDFGGTGTSTGYGVAKASANIPVTMFMVRNYSESGLITREA